MRRPIFYRKTDQHQATYGYCTKCYAYLELWRKDIKSECPHCNTKLFHVSTLLINIILIFIMITFFCVFGIY